MLKITLRLHDDRGLISLSSMDDVRPMPGVSIRLPEFEMGVFQDMLEEFVEKWHYSIADEMWAKQKIQWYGHRDATD